MTHVSDKYFLHVILIQIAARFKNNAYVSISKCNRRTFFAIYGKANRDKITVVEIVGHRPTEFIADFIVPLLPSDIKLENAREHIGKLKIITDVVKKIFAFENLRFSPISHLSQLRFNAVLSN